MFVLIYSRIWKRNLIAIFFEQFNLTRILGLQLDISSFEKSRNYIQWQCTNIKYRNMLSPNIMGR